MKRLVGAMLHGVFPLEQGVEALEKAATKGTLKVQLVMDGSVAAGL
jgi:hypothetical protein